MPAPTRVSDADIDDAIRRYLAGKGRLMAIAVSIGVGVPRLKREMAARGVRWKTPADTLADRQERLRSDHEWREKLSANAKKVAESWGKSEANRERMRQLGRSRRGRKQGPPSDEWLARRSLTHQERVSKLSPAAIQLAEWVETRGCSVTLEKAEGRYNIDVAVGAVAVEVHRYGYNPLGDSRSAARLRHRTHYLCNRGWLVCYVWLGLKGQWFTQNAAEYVAALAKAAESDPTVRGEYRVIRGSGEFVTGGRGDGNEWA